MVLKITFLVILILVFIKLYTKAFQKKQSSRIKLSKVTSTFFSTQKLHEYAKELAQSFSTKNADCGAALRCELSSYYEYITSVYRQIDIKESCGDEGSEAQRWLLDNYYIVEKQIAGLNKALKTKALSDMSVISKGVYEGKATVYALARELVSHHMTQLDYNSIKTFLGAYTSCAYLKSEEIWLFFNMIKLVLVEDIAYLCKKIRFSIKECDYAKRYASYILYIEDRSQIRSKIMRRFEHGRISNTFVDALLRELKNGTDVGAYAATVVGEALEKRSHSIYQCVLDEQNVQKRYCSEMEGCISSIIELENMNLSQLFDDVSEAVRILKDDPLHVYNKMDEESKRLYISEICFAAKKADVTDVMVAKTAQKLASDTEDMNAKHIGYYFMSNGIDKLMSALGKKKRHSRRNILMWSYILSIWLAAVLIGLAAAMLIYTTNIYVACSFGFFVTILATVFTSQLAGSVFLRFKKPKIIPKLDFSAGVDDDCATFVVTTTLIIDKQSADSLARNLEDFYLLNRQKNIYFAILGDFKDSETEEFDEKLYFYVEQLIESLNKKYNFKEKKFYFLLRRKRFSESEGKWMGKERKRGAICDFVRLLKTGQSGDFINASYDYKELNIKYVITLDADTRLRHDSVAKMVGAMAHPLNQPILDEEKNIVTDGYAIMQPRIGIDIESANKSFYTKVYAAYGGLDVYSGAGSDVYQDLFGEAIFVGKGIFDVDVFYRVLDGRFPKEKVLSHDLLEGAYLRCALLSDVVVSDSYPKKYLSHMSRLHRWVRGDWQLIKWLGAYCDKKTGKEKNPLTLLSRYKIFDNLRRSVMSYVKLRLIFASLFLEYPYSYMALSIIFLLGAYPLICSLYADLKAHMTHHMSAKLNANILYGARRASIEFCLDITTLVYDSYVMADAILKALFRLFISKKHLLSWVTAQETEKSNDVKLQLRFHYRRMWISIVTGALVIAVSFFADALTSFICFVLGLWWIIAPYIISIISEPIYNKKNTLHEENKRLLFEIARRMWGYFEDFAGPEHNYLAADNVQLEPKEKIAERTSPTNIGLLLASTLCARDFGYISTHEMVKRIEHTLDTVDKLEKWQGQLLNWYHTKTLEAMEPRYVSTVDNGNYIGDLIMLEQGIKQYINKPAITKKHLSALYDTLSIAMRDDSNLKIDLSTLKNAIIKKYLSRRECIDAVEGLAKCNLFKASSMHEKACKMAQDIISSLENKTNDDTDRRIKTLCKRIRTIIESTSFEALYNEERELFSIGYDINEEKRNNSHYDLLMSEARQTSYICVARSEVSYKHWFALGRNMASENSRIGLLSWTGTMFEYLMPLLLLKNYKDTIFDESYNFVLREQIKCAMRFAPVYGISESGYYSFDSEFNYAYKAFGANALALKHGLSNEKVIAPYASVMSAMLAPNTASENIKNLIMLGAYGKYGLYEALDFTHDRLTEGKNYAVVKSYMVHHIGMSMLALCNTFYENILQKRFMRDAQMRASSYLLGEKIPTNLIVSRKKYEQSRHHARIKNRG